MKQPDVTLDDDRHPIDDRVTKALACQDPIPRLLLISDVAWCECKCSPAVGQQSKSRSNEAVIPSRPGVGTEPLFILGPRGLEHESPIGLEVGQRARPASVPGYGSAVAHEVHRCRSVCGVEMAPGRAHPLPEEFCHAVGHRLPVILARPCSPPFGRCFRGSRCLERSFDTGDPVFIAVG